MTVSFKITNTTNVEGHEDRMLEVVVLRQRQEVQKVQLRPGESADLYAYREQEIYVRHHFKNEQG